MPGSVKADTVLSNKVQISWTAATDNVGVTKYKIFRDQVQIATLLGTQASYTDNTVVANKSYVYGVAAGDAAGNFSTAKSLLVTTPAAQSSASSKAASSVSSSKSSAPSSVSSSSKAASSSSSKAASSVANRVGPWVVNGPVALKWTAPILRENGTALDITEVGGYELRYRESADKAYTYISINDAWKNYYNFSYLTGTYSFQVAAFDKNGLYSNFVDLAPQ